MPSSQPATLRLADQEEAFTVSDKIALGELQMRTDVAKNIMKLFVTTNIFVLVLLLLIFSIDIYFMTRNLIGAGDRIVTENVLMALLGATTVQVGTIMVSISAYLFPRRQTGDEE
ncbi:MAG: hypothetical protein HKM95_14830 [Inquilinus sp.]|nr:hypothetical protein [Inquilinus sp.]